MNQTARYKPGSWQAEPHPDDYQESILRALAYFDIFHYPLSAEEIKMFMDLPADFDKLDTALRQLVASFKIYCHSNWYSLHDNPLLAVRRQRGNQRASELIYKAHKIGRFLYRFPFVRAVGISGSLSKQFASEDADIDFFIITRSNRLWLARTFMHLFKKWTMLTGRNHLYCMNYYIDEEAMELEDKNIFTAIELKTLMPVAGSKKLKIFHDKNDWAAAWLPNYGEYAFHGADRKKYLLKSLFESLLNNQFGQWLDNRFYQWTTNRWKKKEDAGKCNEKGQPMRLITGKHFAKSNAGNLQEKVLSSYEKKVKEVVLD